MLGWIGLRDIFLSFSFKLVREERNKNKKGRFNFYISLSNLSKFQKKKYSVKFFGFFILHKVLDYERGKNVCICIGIIAYLEAFLS